MAALSSSFLPKHPLFTFSFARTEKKRLQTTNKLTAHSADQVVESTAKQPITTPSNQVATHKKRNQSNLLAIVFKSFDDFICKHIDLPLRPSLDPRHVLSGHYAPVDELPPTPCEVVEGLLPSCLGGAYIRNGPNPQFAPPGPYHLFDGDGMLHIIKISQGRATFCSRYVETYKYLVEREVGHPIFPSFFSSFNGLGASVARAWLSVARVLAGQFDPITHGFGLANTSVALLRGAGLLALCEMDRPYVIKVTPDGDVITLGRHDLQSADPFVRMTAHPKIDRASGEAFAFQIDIVHPFLSFFRIDSRGRKQKDVPISSIKGISFIHDFAVTENYAIFPDVQIAFNPLRVLSGKSPMGGDTSKAPRLGIIPKYGEDDSEMWWIDTPGFNLLHCCNAWEEYGGDTMVVVASNMLKFEQAVDSLDSAEIRLEKLVINVKAKTLQRHTLSDKVLEFPVINPAYAARKNRYAYASAMQSRTIAGVVKLDLSMDESDCTLASRLYGPGCCGGEVFFVAREPDNLKAEEDDGYLVTYLHDEITNESKFLVMDAKSPTLDTIAVVKLPQRIPIGFHGLFVSDRELNMLGD